MSVTTLCAQGPIPLRPGSPLSIPTYLVVILSLFLLITGGAMAAPPVEVIGELDVIIKEDFDHGRFEHDYFLRKDDGQHWYQLQFERSPPGHLRSGQRLRARGESTGRNLRVESYEALPSGDPDASVLQEASVLSGPVMDERNALVLMVDLSNAKASTRYTLAQIAGHMFTNPRSVDGLYREASLGQMGFPADTDGDGQPDVLGPFTINYDNSTCKYYDWAYAAEAAAQAAGIDLSRYRHRVFVLPRYSDLPVCTWAGIANVGCGTFCRAWIAEGESGMVYAHELGHNGGAAGGMGHASSDPNNDGTADNVYGDFSDPMGSSRNWHVFNAAHIDQMGWYAGIAGAVVTVAASGTYDLAAIGRDPASAGTPMILKIAKPDSGDYYYVSYRQPISYDSTLSTTYTAGVSIHRYRGSGAGYTSHVTTLTDGGAFNDGVNGIAVLQLSQGNDYATVQVALGCAPATPTVGVSPATLAVKPGAAAKFSVAITNHDMSACAATDYSLEASGAPSLSMMPAMLTLPAGQSGTGTLDIPGGLGEGSHTIRVTATDSDGLEPQHGITGQGIAALLVDGTAPTTPEALTAVATRQGRISLTWQAATDTLSGVSAYHVIRDGTPIGQATGTSYADSSTVGGTTYLYSVMAVDAAGNVSGSSNSVSVTASKGGKK